MQQARANYRQEQATVTHEVQGLQAEFQATRSEAAASAASRLPSVVDTRLPGKPDNFDGSANWKDWSVVVWSYAGACLPQL